MQERDLLAERFEANRTNLRAVAYRMLGSVSEADDAVQEAWLRLSRSETDGIENLGGWLTTGVGGGWPGRAGAEPLRDGRDRDPRRLADDRRRVRLPERAALAPDAPRGAARRPRART